MMSKQYHFRCKSNLKAPLLTLHTAWEAKEMRNHPDYEEIDEFGEIVVHEDEIEGTIPFNGAGGRR
jgi:hypothetical protein